MGQSGFLQYTGAVGALVGAGGWGSRLRCCMECNLSSSIADCSVTSSVVYSQSSMGHRREGIMSGGGRCPAMWGRDSVNRRHQNNYSHSRG